MESKEGTIVFMEYMCISAAVVFIYDYGLTLLLEVKLIWYSRWTYTKVLFLLVRYLTFIDTSLIIYNRLDINRVEDFCLVSYPVSLWFTMLKMFLAEVILAIRTWAVWHRNKSVGFGLAAITLGNLIAQCIFTADNTRRMMSNGGFLPRNYATLTTVEAIVLLLMVISALQSYRMGDVGRLSHIIHRDGILFYVVLLGLSAANVALPKASTMNLNDAMTLLTPLEEVMYSVLTCRIILNIRDESDRCIRNELHTGYIEAPMVFAGPPKPAHHNDSDDCQTGCTQIPPIKFQGINDNSV